MHLMLASLLVAVSAAQTPVILDTDIGDDIDDTWALAMLLGSPEIDLKLIVTASTDTPTKTRLVAKILESMGRTDIPIGTGVKTGSDPINQAKWLGDYSLDQYKGVVHEDGVGKMVEMINASKDKVTLCVIGPQTNIKAALERDPSIAQKARIVSMAGSVYMGYDGRPERMPEFNVFRDVAAARAVFAAPWEITIAPLDTCGTLRLIGERYEAVKKSTNPRAATTIANYDQWVNRHHYSDSSSSVLFDTEAAYLAIDESLCEIKTVNLIIDDKGNTIPDEKGRPVRCALKWKNRDAFENMLIKRLTE